MEQISRALTHSDTKATEVYVNTPNIVDLSTYKKFEQRLAEAKNAKWIAGLKSSYPLSYLKTQKKDTLQNLESARIVDI